MPIDPRIKHVGVSKLRTFNAQKLRELNASEDIYVIQDRDEPVQVLLGYRMFEEMCRVAEAVPPIAEQKGGE